MAAKKKPQAAYLAEPAPDFNWAAGDAFLDSLTPQPEPEKSSFARRAFGDTGIALLKGAIGVPESLVGMADIVSGGYAGKLAEEAGFRPKEAKAILDEYLSPEQQAANREVQQANGFLATMGAALRNPSTIWQGAVESAPSVLTGGAVARGAGAVVPRLGAVARAAIGEGAVSAGQTAEQVRQETPGGRLTGQQAVIAAGSGALTGTLGAIAGKVAQKLGIGDIDTLVTGMKSSPQMQKGVVRSILEGALSEGVLEELPQSVQEQVAQNLALGKPLDEGVDNAAVMGMLSGGLMGAVAGPLGHGPTPEGNAIRDEKLPEVGPLTKALNKGTEMRAAQADAGMPTMTADQATVEAQHRLDELGKKAQGTKDEQLPGPDGEPVTVSGTPGQVLTTAEKTEQQFLTENADNPEALARAQGATISEAAPRDPLPAMHQAAADEAQSMRQWDKTAPKKGDGSTSMPESAVNRALERTPGFETPAATADDVREAMDDANRRDAQTRAMYADITRPGGAPFLNKTAAVRMLQRQADPNEWMVAEAAGGYVLRPVKKKEGPDGSVALPAGRGPAASGGAGSADAGRVVAVDGRPAAAPAGAVPVRDGAAAAPAADAGLAAGRDDAAVAPEWNAFAPESGTKGVPRADMPQIAAEHRGAMVNWLNARGIAHEQETEVDPATLKPTQAEYSPAKVQKARDYEGGDRAILVSSDGYVLDGHHQWLGAAADGKNVRVIRLDATIDKLLEQIKEFPSVGQSAGATAVQSPATESEGKTSGESNGQGQEWRRQEVLTAPGAAEKVAPAPVTSEDTPQSRWTRATEADRLAVLGRAGWSVTPKPSLATQRMLRVAWDKMSDSQRQRIGAALEQKASPVVEALKQAPKEPEWSVGDRASYRVMLGNGKGDPWVEGSVTRVWRDAHGAEHVELDTGHKIDVAQAGERLIHAAPTRDETPDHIKNIHQWWGVNGNGGLADALTIRGREKALNTIGAPIDLAARYWTYLPDDVRTKLAQLRKDGWNPDKSAAAAPAVTTKKEPATDEVAQTTEASPKGEAAGSNREVPPAAPRGTAIAQAEKSPDKGNTPRIRNNSEEDGRWPYPHEFKGAPPAATQARRDVVDYMNGDIDKATLIQKLADSGLGEGMLWNVTNRLEDRFVQSDMNDVEAIREGKKPQRKNPVGYEAAKKGPEVESPAPTADTPAQEPTDDSAATGPAPALDQALAAGELPAEPIRGARQPRARTRRADDGGVRGQGGLFEGVDDGRGDVGDAAGADAVPAGPDGTVERGRDRVPAAPDFRASGQPGALTREGSWFQTASRNVDLIELALRIEQEKRAATPEEQAQLVKYVGFGASEIRNALFPVPSAWSKQQEPDRLIWPSLVREARWKPLAERLAALPKDWQKSVLQSTQYAHYTSENVIRSVWSGLQRLGFTGGKVMEPGMGIGSFAMLMPDAVYKTSKYTGIEFDGPTALIARLLSPRQNMLHDDFIKRRLPKDFFDLAIGNPPFAKTVILGDPDYEKLGLKLHDFFFAKSIDRVRPGGLLVFVTSRYTMDKQNDKARRYLAERADLLGAIRLPQTAFEANAGTKVVTDVIFLRKRLPGEAAAGAPWAGVSTIETKDGNAVVNEYFAAHPEMVLGQQRLSGNRDDQNRYISGLRSDGEYTVVSYDADEAALDGKFAAAVERLPQNAYSPMSATSDQVRAETAKVDFDPKVRREGVVYLADDGTLMRVEQGVGRALDAGVKLSDKDRAWLKGYVGLREQVQLARAVQVADGDWQTALATLNKAYDAFRKEHGPINDFRVQVRKSTDEEGREVETQIRIFKNRRLFREDYDAAIVTQLETITEDGEIVKAPFLLGRTIGKPVTREVKSIGDALAVSLDETGRLDIDDVARRIGLSHDEAIEALGAQVYRTPQGQWQLADEYLSGDVVTKLDEAEDAARIDPSLKRNIEALKAVQPEKLGPSQISVKLGAGWVPAQYVSEFAKEIGAGAVTFDPKTETWQVAGGNLRSERKAGQEYGTTDRSPSELLEAALNSKAVTIKKTVAGDDGKGTKQVTDPEGTTAATEAIRKIKDKFRSWVWTDADRATELVETYNRRFNNIAPRRFDGSHLTLPGVSLRFKLHPHQLRAIWRQVQTGNTYLAHAVGAGKTIEMIAGGMEQKRLGLIRKPIYVVPNHMLEQFANEFMELYPLANIMVADDENFSAERRKAFVAAATLNAPDAIVITHSAFERIGVKEETVAPIRDAMLLDLQTELDDTGKDDRVRRSQLQQQIEAVEQRFDSILGAGKKDSTIKFEDIGADMVYVDEAHAFRKLDFTTNQKIKGIDPNGSRRALDMFVKTRWLESKRPGRAMVFASGTPVTNTMGELYTIMRFFADAEMHRAGMATFDGWSRLFGEAVPALEANAAGRYEVVERFAKFDNVPELMSRVRQFMDVLTSEQLGSLVKRPDIEGGKPNLITVEPTDALKSYMRTVLVPRLEASRKWKPTKDQPFNPDPVIAITSDGRFAALDPRFFGGEVKADTPTKMNEMADRIAAEYKATAGNVYTDKNTNKPEPIKGSTQIVFYNLGFGEQSQKNRGFNARGALTKRLVDQGVAREHILWFDDADTDAKKEAMFKAMRSGQARVLIGSAKKMGTGVNVQKRLSALHYFDPPWYPSDVEQPHGRIIRQGNQNAVVRINWYATKGTYDSTMWQMVGRKQRFIDQAFMGDKSVRSMEDMSEASLYEQAAAVASGDPRALQLAGLRQDVERLERLSAAHTNEQIKVRSALRSEQSDSDFYGKRIRTYEKAFKALGERYFAFTSAKVGGRSFDKQGEFGQALKDAFNQKAADHALNPSRAAIDLATLGDLPIRMHPVEDRKGGLTGTFEIALHVGDLGVTVLNDVGGMDEKVDAAGLTRRFVNAANSVESDLQRARDSKRDADNNVTRLSKKVGAPFEYQQELAEKIGDLKRLEDELKAEGEAEAKAAASAAKTPTIDAEGNADGEKPAFMRTAATGEKVERVQQLADLIAARWTNAPSITVLSSMDDPAVPKVVRDLDAQQKSQGADGEPAGFYHRGTVYLVANQLGGDADTLKVLFHEALGHHGLRGVFGKDLGLILDRVSQLNPGKVRAKAREYGLDFDKLSERRQATEEVLAEMAQTSPELGWVQRTIAAIRSWLREHAPGLKGMAFTDSEIIRSFILPARGWVKNGPETTFVRAAAAPAFSRVGDTMDLMRSAATREGLTNAVADLMRTDRTFNWWHRTIGTQFQKAKDDPEHFGKVYNAGQDYLHDTSAFANDAAALAPDVVPQLKGWRDAMRALRLDEKDGKALAAVVFEGTLNKERYSADQLRAKGLTDRQIKLYNQFRASVDRSLDILVASDVARFIGKDLPPALKAMISDGDTGRFRGLVTAFAQQQKDAADQALKDARRDKRKRMAAMWADQKKRLEGTKPGSRLAIEQALEDDQRKIRAEVDAAVSDAEAAVKKWSDFERTTREKYERIDQLKEEGYAPLMRFGRYTVYVQGPAGEQQFFGLYESQAEANRAARQFRESPEFEGSSVTTGVLSEEAYKQFSGMAPETLELFAEVSGVEKTPLFEEYLRRSKSNRSALKRLISRKGIQGYSEDAQRVLASFLTSNARASASNLHLGDMARLIEQIPKEKGDVKDEAIRLQQYVQNPTEEAQRLRGLLFVQYLGGSAASALVNMTQPFMMTFPYLSQYGGAVKAAGRLAAAMKAAVSKPGGELGRALAKAEKEGIVSPQELHQLQAESSRSMGNHPGVRRLLFVWGSMFSLAEQFNRRVSFIAAWNTANEQGMPNPFKFASEAVDQTQGVYNRGNRPNWARGAVGATVFTFKQYSISYLEFLKRLPPKERAIAIAVLILAAGAQGLPFADDLDDLIDTIGQHLGYDTNVKAWKQQVLSDALGEGAADFALHGFSALPGFPLDVSGRLSLSNLIPGTGLLRKNTTDKSSEVFDLLGPIGGAARDALKGEIRPTSLRNLDKAIEMYQTGEYRDGRDRKVMDVSALDAFVKGVGFQPAEVARESRRIGMSNQQVQLARNIESEIATLWAQGLADREPDKVAEAKERLAQWNADNPRSRIAITSGQLMRRVREMRMSREQRFLKSVPREMRGTVQ